ncbi:hypothetical protein STEG23_021351, partial [Scotinomys teguina]
FRSSGCKVVRMGSFICAFQLMGLSLKEKVIEPAECRAEILTQNFSFWIPNSLPLSHGSFSIHM